MILRVITVLLASAFAEGRAQSFSGRVVGVADGDTINVLRDDRAVRVRLHGIDCPERSQAFGRQARQYTSKLVFGRTVTVHVRGTDRYGRFVADVLPPAGGSLNRELVRAGLAWHYVRYSTDTTLARLESEARASRRGLWADPCPVPPWEFRKERSAVPAGSRWR
jgi:endonuclease YncB( thermonuclease family)